MQRRGRNPMLKSTCIQIYILINYATVFKSGTVEKIRFLLIKRLQYMTVLTPCATQQIVPAGVALSGKLWKIYSMYNILDLFNY